MDHHAAHASGGQDEVGPAPFVANLGFLFGIIAVILTSTIMLSPIGFLAGVCAVALSVVGIPLARVQGRYARGAVAGLFCGALVVVFWLVVRDDITSVAGGRDAWPSWML